MAAFERILSGIPEMDKALSEKGDYVINLLQCRPLQVAQDIENIEIPKELCKEKILLGFIR